MFPSFLFAVIPRMHSVEGWETIQVVIPREGTFFNLASFKWRNNVAMYAGRIMLIHMSDE